MIKTIYHVVSLLGTAQRLLLSLYMEEMKNTTIHSEELGPLDFLPPELMEILEARARSRMIADATTNAFPQQPRHKVPTTQPQPFSPPPLPDWVKAVATDRPPAPPPSIIPAPLLSQDPLSHLPSPKPKPPVPPQPPRQDEETEQDIPVFLIEDLPTLSGLPEDEPGVVAGSDPARPLPSAISGLLYPTVSTPAKESGATEGLSTLRDLLEARSTMAVTPPVFQLPDWADDERQTWRVETEPPTQPPHPLPHKPDLPEWEGSGEGCGSSGCAHEVNVYLSPGEEVGRGRGAPPSVPPSKLPDAPPKEPPHAAPRLVDPDRACTGDKKCKKGFKCMAGNCVLHIGCPTHLKFGPGPPTKCQTPTDPFKLPKSPIESWFTKEVFYDLFPKANIGHGPDECSPYSYEAFIIASRYFPEFGGESPDNGYTKRENARRDLAAFFAHAVQETGENDASLYDSLKKKEEADACFYRGGFFNWFEGGPRSSFLNKESPGFTAPDGELCISAGRYCAAGGELDYWFPCNTDTNSTSSNQVHGTRRGTLHFGWPLLCRGFTAPDGELCISAGRYCAAGGELDYWFPCNTDTNSTSSNQSRKRQKRDDDEFFKGCYFGRGAIQISYNYNYGQFQRWLNQHRINVDLLNEPNLVMTKRDPPLAVLASLWFYMTPQPPKPAMHDIVMGTWEPGEANREAGYSGAIFGPTSLVINNECGGEDPGEPGGPGESRRIKAFKWFCDYFNVPVEEQVLLSCKGMPKLLDGIPHPLSYQPDWTNTWKEQPCDCAPANYGGMIPYFAAGHYPERWEKENLKNRIRCIYSIYDNPSMYGMEEATSACLKKPIPHNLRNQFAADAANEYLVTKP